MGAAKNPQASNLENAKALFDWALKVLPIVGFIVQFSIQFYLQQDRTVDRSKRNDGRIEKLETEVNALERELVQQKIEKGVLEQKVEDQEKYYLLTHPNH